MQNRNSEELFALVKGMSKQEKKSFHLYARRNGATGNLKVLAMYNCLNTMEQYDERRLVARLKGVGARQIPNLKVSLYNLLLDSLRVFNKDQNIDLQLNQLMDHSKILLCKGLPVPALKTLKRLKALALKYHQMSFAFQAVVMEKKIELVHGTCVPGKIEALNREMEQYSIQLGLTGFLSNQSMLLYGWYKRFGSVRNDSDRVILNELFQPLCSVNQDDLSFYPALYLLQARTYYYLAIKETQLFFDAAYAWVSLFKSHPHTKEVELLQYQRGLVYLSEAALMMHDAKVCSHAVGQLKDCDDAFYFQLARLNLALLENNFDMALLREAESLARSLSNPESVVVLCYKASLLCLHQKKFEKLVGLTHVGVNVKSGPRLDLQYQLRLMQVEGHKELENMELVESLELSAQRFGKNNFLTPTESPNLFTASFKNKILEPGSKIVSIA